MCRAVREYLSPWAVVVGSGDPLARTCVTHSRPLRADQLASQPRNPHARLRPGIPLRVAQIAVPDPRATSAVLLRVRVSRPTTSRTQPATCLDHGIANRLVIDTKPLSDLLQGEPVGIENCCADTASFIEARSPYSTTRTKHELRDRATVHSVLRGYHAYGHPGLIVREQFRAPLGGQSCLRLRRIFRDRASQIVSLRGSVPRSTSRRAPENMGNQRFQRRALV